jgi:hypothetical protein
MKFLQITLSLIIKVKLAQEANTKEYEVEAAHNSQNVA